MEEDILKYLNENHGWDYRDMLPFLMTRFHNPNEGTMIAIRSMLQDLVNSGFLVMRNNSYNNFGSLVQYRGSATLLTLQLLKDIIDSNQANWNLQAMITSAGKKELQEIEFRKMTMATNAALERSSIASINAGRQMELATWVIAIATIANVIIAAAPHNEKNTSKTKIEQSSAKPDTSKISNSNSNKK